MAIAKLASSTITGGTDGTAIGNASDRLKVDIASVSGTVTASFSSKIRAEASFTTIALSTGSFTNIYTYSGTGFLHGFNIEFNNASIIPRLQIDGETVFSAFSISQWNSLLGTGNDAARRQAGGGIVTSGSTIDFSMKQPIKFNSSVTISADANGGVLLSRNFTQGLFYISKET